MDETNLTPQPHSELSDPGMAALVAKQRQAAEPELLLSWEAVEYPHYERTRTWYLIAGACACLMIVYAIVTEAYMTAVAVALLAGVIYLYSHEMPAIQQVLVSRLGISVGPRFYPFASIKNFWLVINRDVRQLSIETSGRFGQNVVIQLGEMDPVLVRKTLSQEIPEATGRDESNRSSAVL